jgi:ATP-binding cassette subfamily F protein uup
LLLRADSISKTHGFRTLFSGVSLTIQAGERVGLIGANGNGKSTLLKLLAAAPGEDLPDEGAVIQAKGLRAAYIAQLDTFSELPEFPPPSPRDIITHAARQSARSNQDAHDAELLAEIILSKAGFDEHNADAPYTTLSGGWRKRLSIARAFARCAGEPDLLLLDEPTNHLDLSGVRWLEDLLKKPHAANMQPFASIFVTHDRAFLESIATRIIELSPLYPGSILAVEGNYSEILRRKEEFLDAQSRAQQSLANQVRKDLAWLARGPQARRTKSKSRITASHERIDQLSDLRQRTSTIDGAKVDFTSTGRRTRKLLVATDISKSLGNRTLFTGVNLVLGAGECLGLLGANGSGKTTLIRVLTGDLPPDTGSIRLADPTPRVVLFSQHRVDFPPTMLLSEALCPVSDQVRLPGGQAMHITAWSRRFLFRDEQLQQQMRDLSGGELARVHIARMMLQPADILILDEPTNDLDIPTLEILEESLESFEGAVVLVTHDRAMLGRLATEVLVLDGTGGTALHTDLDQALRALEQSAEPARESPPTSTPATSSPSTSPSAPTSPTPPTRKKLSYNEQREYDGLEQRILEAETRATALEAKLADPAIANDHTRFAAACKDLGDAQALVASLYARWEALEAKLAPS